MLSQKQQQTNDNIFLKHLWVVWLCLCESLCSGSTTKKQPSIPTKKYDFFGMMVAVCCFVCCLYGG
jgi:hypothetical protein